MGFRRRTGFPYRLGFRRAGAEFKQLPGSFRREEIVHLTAKCLLFHGPEQRDLAEERFEVIAGQRPNGEEVRGAGIEIGFDLGFGKDNAAFAAIGQDDPLRALAVLVQQGQVFGRAGSGLVFQPVLDLLELLIEERELLVNRETAFDQLGNLTLTCGGFGFHEPSPTRVHFCQFRRADERRQVPIPADIRR